MKLFDNSCDILIAENCFFFFSFNVYFYEAAQQKFFLIILTKTIILHIFNRPNIVRILYATFILLFLIYE